MINPRKEADRIIDKLLASTVKGMQLAVFVFPDGSVKTTRPDSDLCREKEKRFPKAFVGVYSSAGLPDALAADIVATLEEQGIYLKVTA